VSASARRTPTRTASVVLVTLALVVAGLLGTPGPAGAAAPDRAGSQVTAEFTGVLGGLVAGARGHVVAAARGVPSYAAPADAQGHPLAGAVLPAAAFLVGLLAYRRDLRGLLAPRSGRTDRLRHQRAPPRTGALRAA
jgi:hypothetical protein